MFTDVYRRLSDWLLIFSQIQGQQKWFKTLFGCRFVRRLCKTSLTWSDRRGDCWRHRPPVTQELKTGPRQHGLSGVFAPLGSWGQRLKHGEKQKRCRGERVRRQEIEHFDAGNTIIAVAQIPKVSQARACALLWTGVGRRGQSISKSWGSYTNMEVS